MGFQVLSAILCLAGYSYASWLCPVYRTNVSGQVEEISSENHAILKSWYATIQPVSVENPSMLNYAPCDYAICENLVLTPPVSGGSILVCLDLGVCPELTRELESFWVNEVPIEPRNMLGSYPNEMNILDDVTESNYLSANSEFHIHRYDTENGAITRHELRPIEEYRSLFDSEEDFRSAVPETRRFYADMWEIPCNGKEEIVVEVHYLVHGWTYLTGIEPLRFSMCQPLLWNGPLNEGRIVFERPWTDTPEMWFVEFDGSELPSEDTYCYEVEVSNLNIAEDESIPFLLVEPATAAILK